MEGPVDYRVSRKYLGISRVEGSVDYRVSRKYSGISRVEGLSVQELLGK